MIHVHNLVKHFDSTKPGSAAVAGVSFEIPEGRLYTLLGPSGCGKTTTLRVIAGLERATAGEVVIGDQTVSDPAHGVHIRPNRRPIGMVFQSYAVWPHMNVLQNVAFPLAVQRPRLSQSEIRSRATEALSMVGLHEFADKPATLLSGGQQQRVALARALIRRPKVLLLDEPLSNLDANLRERMREEIRILQLRTGVTLLYVTHDQSEALAISDMILIMKDGRIVESGPPQDVYRRPRSEFGAGFVGQCNRLDGVLVANGDGQAAVQTRLGLIDCSMPEGLAPGDAVTLFLRPEDLRLTRKRHSEAAWEGTVAVGTYQGDSWDYQVTIGGVDLRARLYIEKVGLSFGDRVFLEVEPDSAIVMRRGAGPT